ncbi:ankyrin repeat-containing domain protein [Aspergillus avenaceus]|uniref:Ankyrin repeat-containing domain protein n=1 Tax=Aspergillus avenaceus TaxID=36643 RepID=A0A5N6U009_ASPAV|nr:ankyrin repeat-containing domain protein [Aspergillus avenaceus]
MQLLHLPNELLQIITDNLIKEADINALMQVNRSFYDLLESRLYQVNIQYGESSALVWAAAQGHLEVAKRCLRANANVNTLGPLHASIDQSNLTACPSIAFPPSAVYTRSISATGCRWRSTPLMLAAARGHKDIVELLAEHGANFNFYVGDSNPILAAVGRGHTAVVKYLLTLDVDLSVGLDILGYTPLVLAAGEGHTEIVKVLMQHGIDPNDVSDGTPLIHAAREGRVEAARALLDGGANMHLDGNPVMLGAIDKNDPTMVNLLLDYGSYIECEDNFGQTPLSYAAEWGSWKAAEVLLRRGANIHALVGDMTPLSLAIKMDRVRMVELLLDNGAEPTIFGQPMLAKIAPAENLQMIRLLLERGQAPNCCDYRGRTPLFFATMKQNLEMMRLFLERGADPNIKSCGIELLTWAILGNHAAVVDMLLAYGASY